jgi:hypothetical protein
MERAGAPVCAGQRRGAPGDRTRNPRIKSPLWIDPSSCDFVSLMLARSIRTGQPRAAVPARASLCRLVPPPPSTNGDRRRSWCSTWSPKQRIYIRCSTSKPTSARCARLPLLVDERLTRSATTAKSADRPVRRAGTMRRAAGRSRVVARPGSRPAVSPTCCVHSRCELRVLPEPGRELPDRGVSSRG